MLMTVTMMTMMMKQMLIKRQFIDGDNDFDRDNDDGRHVEHD